MKSRESCAPCRKVCVEEFVAPEQKKQNNSSPKEFETRVRLKCSVWQSAWASSLTRNDSTLHPNTTVCPRRMYCPNAVEELCNEPLVFKPVRNPEMRPALSASRKLRLGPRCYKVLYTNVATRGARLSRFHKISYKQIYTIDLPQNE